MHIDESSLFIPFKLLRTRWPLLQVSNVNEEAMRRANRQYMVNCKLIFYTYSRQTGYMHQVQH